MLEGARPGAKVLIEADGSASGSLGSPELDDEAHRLAEEFMWKEASQWEGSLFVDVIAPAPRLILFGAVDVAASLCRLARAAGWRPYVVDPRRSATRERFPEALEVVTAWPEEAFAQLGGIDRATSIAVLTHDPKLDDAALQIALRSSARFVGAMGSRRAQAARCDAADRRAGSARRRWAAWPRRSDSTSGRSAARRPPCRFSPRSWPPVTGRDGGRLSDARGLYRRGPGLIAGLILAAGAGTRFGPEFKLLAELDGRPVLEHAVRSQCAVPELDPVVVVLGSAGR